MTEQTQRIGGFTVTYRSKSGKYDTRHLLIVFSGFGATGEFTYDFTAALTDCPTEVIWIKDDFLGHASYYLCAAGNPGVADAVHAFISAQLAERGLSAADCTLLGASKGGSAALYFGLRYGFSNIIAAVPQFRIGSYVRDHWGAVFAHMVPDKSTERTEQLDGAIADAAAQATADKNIYLISSTGDPQFASQIEPNLGLLRGLGNFNLIMANSALVTQHNQVTGYCVPIILSLVNALTYGLAPRFARETLAVRTPRDNTAPSLVPHVALRQARFSGHRFFPEGISVIRGVPCPDYADIRLTMILKAGASTIELPLAKGNKSGLTRELYDGTMVAYDKGWFCTAQYKGVDIGFVPPGRWQMFIEIRCRGVQRLAPVRSDDAIFVHYQTGDTTYRVESSAKSAFLVKS